MIDVFLIIKIVVRIVVTQAVHKEYTRGGQTFPSVHQLCTKDFQKVYNWDTLDVQVASPRSSLPRNSLTCPLHVHNIEHSLSTRVDK